MSRRANAKMIGAFVLGAVAILVAVILVLGSGRFFVRMKTYVLFFQEDVAGLNVGAPVLFRGVRIGSVTDILIRYEADQARVYIPVYVTIQPSKVIVGEPNGNRPPEALVEAGLRAQLRTQSFVTGLLAVNLDFEPNVPPRFAGIDKRYPEIPTVRSAFTEARATLTDLVNEIRKLPIAEMLQQLSSSARNLDRLVADTDELVRTMHGDLSATMQELPPMLRNISQAANEVTALARNVDAGVPGIRDGAQEAVTKLNDTLDQVQKAVGGIQSAVGETSPLQSQMARTLSDIGDAAVAVRALAEYLNQNPRALLTGRGKDGMDDAR
ncbi:MAG: MlaD family protein [Gemmatimonas sp.]